MKHPVRTWLHAFPLTLAMAIPGCSSLPKVQQPTPPPAGSGQHQGEAQQTAGNGGLPFFGFNAKGSAEVDRQTALANSFLDRITDAGTKHDLVIRINGGTLSQTTTARDWPDAAIAKWADLQKRQGVRFTYTVNGNDPPADQAAMIQRWLDAGVKFDFIEMMNEYYLPKFTKGDRSFEEVSRAISPELYVNEILPAYWAALDRFNLPYYVIFAPDRPGRSVAQQKRDNWNSVVGEAVRTKYRDRNLNATIHLYEHGGEADNFDYAQIDRLRAMLPPGRHIAVTEAGIINRSLTTEQLGKQAAVHYANIVRHLHAGDYLMDQVLFSPWAKNPTATLNEQGITPKGEEMLQFIQRGLK